MAAVELHPILEAGVRPSPDWWYVLSISGNSPSMRVGHTATFVPALHPDEHDRVFVIGGANPEQVFSEVHVLDLHLRSWDSLEAPGFRGRYEHAAFYVENHPGAIFVFGGATQTSSLNDVQRLDVLSGVWLNVEVAGTPPAPRTHHTSAVIGPKVYFYSGGHSGPDPVGDRRVHCLDTTTMTWIMISPRGDPPKPRHGHVMVAHGNRIILHGGMSGSTFYDDLFMLDLDLNSWTSIKKKKTSPSARAAHSGVVHNKKVILFGGMNKAGALDDGYTFNTENNQWSKLQCEGPAPPNRLDFAMCTIKLRVPLGSTKSSTQESQAELIKATSAAHNVLEAELSRSSAASVDSSSNSLSADDKDCSQDALVTSQAQELSSETGKQKEDTEPEMEEICLILINGGMDTEGEIFDDTLVLIL